MNAADMEMPSWCVDCERTFELNDLMWDMRCRECHDLTVEEREQNLIERHGL